MDTSGEGNTKGRQGQEEEMGKGKEHQQAVNRLGGANHKGFEAQIHFLLLEHDFEFSSGGCNGTKSSHPKNLCLSRGIGAGPAHF